MGYIQSKLAAFSLILTLPACTAKVCISQACVAGACDLKPVYF